MSDKSNVGDGYKWEGKNWRVTDVTAGIITIRDKHGEEHVFHQSFIDGNMTLYSRNGQRVKNK